MNIVQTFWTKPFLCSELTMSKLSGGWPNKLYNYFSVALSVLLLRRQFNSVHLYTDELGNELLIEKMKLPYTQVHVSLDKLNHYDEALWAISKIYTYSVQNQPFIHIDNDIFIWKKFHRNFTAARVLAQSPEDTMFFYKNSLLDIVKNFNFIPEYLAQLSPQAVPYIPATNAGIIGGNDVDFFQFYTKEVFDFVNRNITCVGKLEEIRLFNCIFEQLVFHQLASVRKINIKCLFPETPNDVGFFQCRDRNEQFVHAMGGYKKKMIVAHTLEKIFAKSFPEYHKRILDLVKSREL